MYAYAWLSNSILDDARDNVKCIKVVQEIVYGGSTGRVGARTLARKDFDSTVDFNSTVQCYNVPR